MFFGSTKDLRVGQRIFRTKERLFIPVGTEILGRIIDSIGYPLDGLKKYKN